VKAAFLFASLKIALFRTNKKNNSHSLGVFGSIISLFGKFQEKKCNDIFYFGFCYWRIILIIYYNNSLANFHKINIPSYYRGIKLKYLNTSIKKTLTMCCDLLFDCLIM
jgi:hypothetical protein